MRGEWGSVRFIANRSGFRYDRDVAHEKPSGTFRVILLGDSFVVGYRTDQEQTMGAHLERRLKPAVPSMTPQVLVAGHMHPGGYLRYLRKYAFRFHPDVILVGITIGNDITESYRGARGERAWRRAVKHTFLPADAFDPSPTRNAFIRLDRSLQRWHLYRLLSAIQHRGGIFSMLGDYPGHVHVFDLSHGLAYFYTEEGLPLVRQAYQALASFVGRMKGLCESRQVPLVVMLLPQRFQVNTEEWEAVMFQYGLRESAFDPDRPSVVLDAQLRKIGVIPLDLTGPLRKGRDSYYMTNQDMHMNEAGQAASAAIILDEMQRRHLLPQRPHGAR